jgi:hypothetical protein
MSMIAAGPGSFLTLPQMYMRKMAVGPVARGRIDLAKPVADNVRAIADALGRNPNDVTAIVLDRPRHHDLIEELRGSGARIKLIQDGDVTSAITAAIRGTNDHLAIGIGGARQAVIAAAALRCLGGELQAQFWPVSRSDIAQAREYGFEDMEKVFTIEELAPRDVIVAATGVPRAICCAACATWPTAPDALPLVMHSLQLGPLRRRHPLLRARAPRGDPPARIVVGPGRLGTRGACPRERKCSTRCGSSRIRSSGWTSSSSGSCTTPRCKTEP